MLLNQWTYDYFSNLPQQENKYDFVFTGSVCDLDDRTAWVDQYCSNVAEQRIVVRYEHTQSKNSYLVNGQDMQLSSIENLRDLVVLIEATSLDFPELLLVVNFFLKNQISFDICYVEPEKYFNFATGDDEHSSYVISDEGFGLEFIPEFTCSAKPSRTLIVALGFEGHRFGGIIESEEFFISKTYALLGVPAFNPGMEKESLKANYKQLSDSNSTLKVAPANDPYDNYRTLIKLLSAVRSNPESKFPEPLVVAPFGTKPTSIALIFFAVTQKNVGVIYDFAKRKKGRTTGIGNAHIWSFDANNSD